MLRMVHRDPGFEKQTDQLQKADKKAAIAVKEADNIIHKLASGVPPESAGLMTRHGEYRVHNCLKYDLGGGYRLITVKNEDHLFVMFIGTHDECHRWLENKKSRQPKISKNRSEKIEVSPPCETPSENPEAGEKNLDAYDYLDQIDDKYLRVIFQGLCGG